jgi:flagellar hook-basal body complex protein FliE
MTDPLGLLGNAGSIGRSLPVGPGAGAAKPDAGPDFKQFLTEQIAKVNQLQKDATVAIEDLAAGRRNDLENVMIATQKADTAFKLLLQVRNKVMEAYDEVKQIRV